MVCLICEIGSLLSLASTAHLANAHKIRSPNVVAAEALFRGMVEIGSEVRITQPALFHVVEIVFVQHHAIVFEAWTTRDFRIGGHLFLIHFSTCKKLGNLFCELVLSI